MRLPINKVMRLQVNNSGENGIRPSMRLTSGVGRVGQIGGGFGGDLPLAFDCFKCVCDSSGNCVCESTSC